MSFMPASIRGDDSYYDEMGELVTANSSESQNDTEFMNEQSSSDMPIDYSSLIQDNVFIGEYPLQIIIEGITSQFEDYIDMDDNTNYVDAFYTQLEESYQAMNNEEEEHPDEIMEALDNIYQIFIDKITELFEQRLTLTIPSIESGDSDREDAEFIIRRLYEFFILGAKTNFKSVIASDILSKANLNIENDTEYYRTLRELLSNYSPIITAIGPMEFLKYRGDEDIRALFDDGKVAGNFLRKYSPKLYSHIEYEVELISYITMMQQVKGELYGAN